ncbi:MAG: hypothetical protein DRJ98_02060 [Thermoprotei archaeon]|nr:MAG: hypothetical protein DRJ98_02060 [Thermoprotei archaeon]RLF18749.1 MAG: hypothetical protein DRN06_00495 [Thermoprotei archaeon]
MAKEKEDLREAVLKAIDYALQLFGESVYRVVYYYCEAKFNVKRDELTDPEKIVCLADCITEIFKGASSFLEEQIISSICRSLNVDRKTLPKGFKEALKKLTAYASGAKP